jgi:hypothetical protein
MQDRSFRIFGDIKDIEIVVADVPLDTFANHAAQLGGRQSIKLDTVALEFVGMGIAGTFGRPGRQIKFRDMFRSKGDALHAGRSAVQFFAKFFEPFPNYLRNENSTRIMVSKLVDDCRLTGFAGVADLDSRLIELRQ